MTERPIWHRGPGVAERARMDMAATLRRAAERLEQASAEQAMEFLLRTADAIRSIQAAAETFLSASAWQVRQLGQIRPRVGW